MDDETNACQDLNDFLAGTLKAEYFADVDQQRRHWKDCATCRISFPNAVTEIKRAEDLWLRQIKRIIEHLYREYNIVKSALLLPVSPEPPDLLMPRQVVEFVVSEPHREDEALKERESLHAKLLVMLSEKGEIIREHLQIMNDNWGLDYFRLAFEDSADSCEYDSRVCGSLISSLSREVQLFVFQSILTSDVLKYFDIELSPGLGWTFYRTLEYAAPEYLRLYLESQESQTLDQDISGSLNEADQKDLSILVEKIDSLEDGVDSLKAGQMELCRLSKLNTYKATEIEDDLMNHFGKELYGRLSSEARRHLNEAEALFRQNLDTDKKDFRGSLLDFQRGYACEFRYRISGPLTEKLVEMGYTNYPNEETEKKLVKEGKFNGALSLGDQLWYLWHDERVRTIIAGLDLSVATVQKCASRINKARCTAAHNERSVITEVDVRQVRDILRDGLRALFP